MLEIVPPTSTLSGSVTLPGSKSITNRALLLAALADGESQITGALKSDDTKFMVEGLQKLGIQIGEPDDTTFVVQGRGGKLDESPEPLFLGNAGTATRFLTAAASLVVGETVITGNERMNKRPIEDLTSALAQLGVKVETNEGCPPVKIISTGKLTGQVVKIRGNVSSQFVSALLMLLPNAAEEIRLELDGRLTSKGYVDITTAVMAGFGVIPLSSDNGFKIPHKTYSATNFAVEPDASSATYFWAAEKLLSQMIEITNAPKMWIQPDAEAWEVMERFPEPFG